MQINTHAVTALHYEARCCNVALDAHLTGVDLFCSPPVAVLTCERPVADPFARAMQESALVARASERLPGCRIEVHIPQALSTDCKPTAPKAFAYDDFLLHDTLRSAVHMSLRSALCHASSHLPWSGATAMRARAMIAAPSEALLAAACFPERFQLELQKQVDASLPRLLLMLEGEDAIAVQRDIKGAQTLMEAYEKIHAMGSGAWSPATAKLASAVFKL